MRWPGLYRWCGCRLYQRKDEEKLKFISVFGFNILISAYHNENFGDPDAIYCNGKFHYLYAYEDKLWIKSSTTLEGLKQAKSIVVYEPNDMGIYNTAMWAPELHFINGKRHIYLTIGNHENGLHHMFVLTNDSKSPLDKYHNVAYLDNGNEDWAIDATILRYNGKLYYIWSAFPSHEDRVPQNLYISKMKYPYHLGLSRKFLSAFLIFK